MTEQKGDAADIGQQLGEIVELPPEARARRLTALWQRLMDPDGFDRAALAIEGATHTDQNRGPATLWPCARERL